MTHNDLYKFMTMLFMFTTTLIAVLAFIMKVI